MSDPAGWIPAHRKLFDPGHALAPSKRDPACQAYAWLDICQLAQHQPRKHAGILLKRGEVLLSVRTLGSRWFWSKSRVQRFLSNLEKSEALEITVNFKCSKRGTLSEPPSGTPLGTVYRVVNYDTYAVVEKPKRDTSRDTLRDTRGTPAGQEQEQKHLTISNNKETTAVPAAILNGNGGGWNGGAVVDLFVQYCRKTGWPDPPRSQMGKMGAAAKRLSVNDRETMIRAMVGMGCLFPYSEGEPWDLMDLEKKFTKASAAAMNHPKVKEREFRAAFLEGDK